jgi:hypothetical protein
VIDNIFNILKFAAWPTGKHRKRIRDRGIKWEEGYREKSAPLRKRFLRDIGIGSYYRWEGHDYTTDSDYFVVVGPAQERYGKKSFFSGIKKLPPKTERKKIYAPSGKYFTNIVSALSHANRMWNTPFPRNQINYTTADLANINIPRRLKA